jgi:hypothetical protein
LLPCSGTGFTICKQIKTQLCDLCYCATIWVVSWPGTPLRKRGICKRRTAGRRRWVVRGLTRGQERYLLIIALYSFLSCIERENQERKLQVQVTYMIHSVQPKKKLHLSGPGWLPWKIEIIKIKWYKQGLVSLFWPKLNIFCKNSKVSHTYTFSLKFLLLLWKCWNFFSQFNWSAPNFKY